MTEFSEVKDTNTQEFNAAMNIYSESFPATERQSTDTIKERVGNGKEKLFIQTVEGTVALMALLYPLEGTEFVLLDYMAVKEEYRNSGIGSELLQNIYSITGWKNKLFIVEVEDPKNGTDQEQATKQRRVYFYRKNGAKILKHMQYLLPPLQGNSPIAMTLLVISQNKRLVWLSGEAIKDVIVKIYEDLYCRDVDDRLLSSFIDSIPERVTLQ